MYEYIVDPQSNKIQNITSKIGKRILYKYLSILKGGTQSTGPKKKKENETKHLRGHRLVRPDQQLNPSDQMTDDSNELSDSSKISAKTLSQQLSDSSKISAETPSQQLSDEPKQPTIDDLLEKISAIKTELKKKTVDSTLDTEPPIQYHEKLDKSIMHKVISKLKERERKKHLDGFSIQILSKSERDSLGITQKEFQDLMNGFAFINQFGRNLELSDEKVYTLSLVTSLIHNHLKNLVIPTFMKNFGEIGFIKELTVESSYLHRFFFSEVVKYYFENSNSKDLIEKYYSLEEEIITDIESLNSKFPKEDDSGFRLELILSDDIKKKLFTITIIRTILRYNIIIDSASVLEVLLEYISNRSNFKNLEEQLYKIDKIFKSHQEMINTSNIKANNKFFTRFLFSLDQIKLKILADIDGITVDKYIEKQATLLDSSKTDGRKEKGKATSKASAEKGVDEKATATKKAADEKAAAAKMAAAKKAAAKKAADEKAAVEEAERKKAEIQNIEQILQDILKSIDIIKPTAEALLKIEDNEYDTLPALITEMNKWTKYTLINTVINQHKQKYSDMYNRLLKSWQEKLDNRIEQHNQGIPVEDRKLIEVESIDKVLEDFDKSQLSELKTINKNNLHQSIQDIRQILERTTEINKENLKSKKIASQINQLKRYKDWITEQEKKLYHEITVLKPSTSETSSSLAHINSLTTDSFSNTDYHKIITEIYTKYPKNNVVIIDGGNFLPSEHNDLLKYQTKYDKFKEEVRQVNAIYVVIKEESLIYIMGKLSLEDMYSEIYNKVNSYFKLRDTITKVILIIIFVDKYSIKDKKTTNCLKDLGLKPMKDSKGEYIANKITGKTQRERFCEIYDSDSNPIGPASHDACGYDDMFARGMAEWDSTRFMPKMVENIKLLTGETKGGLGEQKNFSLSKELFDTYFKDAKLNFKVCTYIPSDADKMSATSALFPSQIYS